MGPALNRRNCRRPEDTPHPSVAPRGYRWRCTVCDREWVRSDDDPTQTGPEARKHRAGKRGWRPADAPPPRWPSVVRR